MFLCGEQVKWERIEERNDHADMSAMQLLQEMLLMPKNSGGDRLSE